MTNESEYLLRLDQLVAKAWPADVPRQPDYPFGEVPLTEYLSRWARKHPDKPVVIFYGRELTFAELDDLSNRFAALLVARGVGKGDRVAVFLPTCPQFLIAFYGILKTGAVHVPVNPLFKADEVIYELGDTDAEVMVAHDQLMDMVRAVKSRSKLRHVFVTSFADMLPPQPTLPVPAAVAQPRISCPDAEDLLAALATVEEGPLEHPPAQLDDIAALNYTGGTTGMPKGCVHTQRNMLYTAATTATIAMGLRDDDISVSVAPVFWIAGENAGVILPVFRGITCVMLARWDPVAWMAGVDRYKATTATLVLDLAVEVMDHPDVHRYDLRSLRATRVSSFVKKLTMAYRERWRELIGVTLMESAWGMTETHTMDTFTRGMQQDDMDLKAQPVFVGLPMPGTQLKICDFETGELKALGEEGELCARTPSMLKGYWNSPEASAEAIKDGWLHTGDIGLIDESGYLHFLGRRKEMLKVKGMSVFPSEIEALLGNHPAVIGSGVVGRPDAERGQVPVAFVRIAPEHAGEVTAESLEQWCRARMAVYKVPEVHLVDELPTTATGKVKKGELPKLP